MRHLLVYPAALVLALSPLAFVHPVRVQGRSMEPALADGRLCLGIRAWCAPAPRPGEVWLLDSPEGPVVKRVLALPGESLSLRDGKLWRGEALLREDYVGFPESGWAGPWPADGGYLVLGDNRPLSRDGRQWGPLPRKAFRSRIIY